MKRSRRPRSTPRWSCRRRSFSGCGSLSRSTAGSRARRCELYYLRPLLILIVFFRLADVLRVFDHVFILTGGGPGNTTQLLSLYLYRVEFKFSDYGQAAALAVVVLIAISVVYSLVTRVLPLERR